MCRNSMGPLLAGALAVSGLVGPARAAYAQDVDPAVMAYMRAAAEHFGVPGREVLILADWQLPAPEIPVVLFYARAAGVSLDALASARGAGESWDALGRSHGVDLRGLHTQLEEPPEPVASAYRSFAGLPRERWGEVRLSDEAVIFLVNLRFLTERLRLPPERVVAAWRSAGSFPAAHRELTGR